MSKCNCSCNLNRDYSQNNFRNNSNINTCNTNTVLPQNENAFPENYLFGHAYTPNFTMSKTFTPEDGLCNGTIFPELVSPYRPGQSMDFINYLRSGGM